MWSEVNPGAVVAVAEVNGVVGPPSGHGHGHPGSGHFYTFSDLLIFA